MKLNVAVYSPVGEARHAQRALVTRGEIFFLFGGFHGRHFHHGAGHTLLGVGIDQRGGHRALLCRSHGRRAGEEENQECFFHYSISGFVRSQYLFCAAPGPERGRDARQVEEVRFSQREGTYFLFSAVRPSGESPEKGGQPTGSHGRAARVRHSVSGPVLRVACRVLCGAVPPSGALPGGASAVREMLRRHLSARLGFGRTAAKKGVSPGGSHP